MDKKDTTALRKRAQISKANKTMFVWVACASVVVSVAAVLVVMMVQKGMHNQKAISELNNTVRTLRQNNEVVGELENQVRALGSNEALLKLRASDDDNALQVILDALPAEPNPSALGASLQSKLLSGVSVESVQITPIEDVALDAAPVEEATTDASGEAESADTAEATNAPVVGRISFQFSVQGEPDELKELLNRLERSIRTIQISHISLESSGGRQVLSVEGEAYYLPAKQIELNNVDIKR